MKTSEQGRENPNKRNCLCKPVFLALALIADSPSAAHYVAFHRLNAAFSPHLVGETVSEEFMRLSARRIEVLCARFKHICFAEEKRYAPDCADTYKDVDYSADNGSLSPENKCDQVELENTDKSPVYSADNQQK
jgi:hypothetical protein